MPHSNSDTEVLENVYRPQFEAYQAENTELQNNIEAIDIQLQQLQKARAPLFSRWLRLQGRIGSLQELAERDGITLP